MLSEILFVAVLVFFWVTAFYWGRGFVKTNHTLFMQGLNTYFIGMTVYLLCILIYGARPLSEGVTSFIEAVTVAVVVLNYFMSSLGLGYRYEQFKQVRLMDMVKT